MKRFALILAVTSNTTLTCGFAICVNKVSTALTLPSKAMWYSVAYGTQKFAHLLHKVLMS